MTQQGRRPGEVRAADWPDNALVDVVGIVVDLGAPNGRREMRRTVRMDEYRRAWGPWSDALLNGGWETLGRAAIARARY